MTGESRDKICEIPQGHGSQEVSNPTSPGELRSRSVLFCPF
jgi:hypothetical protein